MTVDMNNRLAQFAAVNDARVVQAVAQDRIACRRDSGNDPRVCRISGVEKDRCFRFLELRDLAFEFCMKIGRARDQSRRSGTEAMTLHGGACGLPERRVFRETQIVVGTHKEHALAVYRDPRPLGRPHYGKLSEEMLITQLYKFLFEHGYSILKTHSLSLRHKVFYGPSRPRRRSPC